MAALVLYRKYRPKVFEDVVGQEHVVQTLQNALKLNRVGHAYLFSGPRGTGKTSIARLLARYVNCVYGDDQSVVCSVSRPCVNCASFFNISQPDLIEVDAASNRGIDEIRQLREGVRVSPIQAPFKVYIIDEAHMLTKEASNALLKTLEEPPAHAIFVLATTDVDKLLPTILSRCQRFDFRLLTVGEIARRLALLIKSEKREVDSAGLELLAQAADGSIRDAESFLEQVLALFTGKATREDILEILGITDPLVVSEIGGAILEKNPQKGLETLSGVIEKGGDAQVISAKLASYLRDVLLINADPSLAKIIEKQQGAAYVAGVKKHAEQADQKFLTALIPKVIEAVDLSKYSPVPSMPLELVIIESASL